RPEPLARERDVLLAERRRARAERLHHLGRDGGAELGEPGLAALLHLRHHARRHLADVHLLVDRGEGAGRGGEGGADELVALRARRICRRTGRGGRRERGRREGSVEASSSPGERKGASRPGGRREGEYRRGGWRVSRKPRGGAPPSSGGSRARGGWGCAPRRR